MRSPSILLVAAIAVVGTSSSARGGDGPTSKSLVGPRDLFRSPPVKCRPLVRWWWFGVAVTNDEIANELVQMRDAGFGGVEIQPVYPLSSDGEYESLHTLPYLSRGFLSSLAFAASKAKDLGLTVDIALGSGWPIGGPHVTADHGARTLSSNPSNWPAGVATREQVKGAAVGAEGAALGPYSSAAVAQHLHSVGDKLLTAAHDNQIQAVFSDRPQWMSADWTSDFTSEFKRRRGYEVDSLLSSLAEHDAAASNLRHDWAVTLSDLLDERFFAQVQDWSHGHQVAIRGQPFGTLPATLSSARFVDVPEGEGLPWNALTASRWASSAAHLFAKSLASAAVWASAPLPAFRASPLDLKAETDQYFLSGATQIVGQGWPYSPEQAGNPGWAFGSAAAISPHNPWWPVMPELTMYLRRTTFAIRQGDAVNDVAIYLPTHDAFAALKPDDVNLNRAVADRIGPDLIPTVLRAGYGFDLIDDNVLVELAKVSAANLKIGRQDYAVVILANVERIPLATMEKLEAFVAAGSKLIATRRLPALLPNRAEQQDHGAVLDAKVAKLFGGGNAPAKLVRDEIGELGGLLRALLQPDMRTATVAPQIGFVHRRAVDVDLYFIANTWNEPYASTIELRVPPRPAEWWDAMTGDLAPAPTVTSSPTSTTVQLSLPAYGTRILVFGLPARGRPAKTAARKTDNDEPPVSMDISNGWEITFEGTTIKRQSDWLTSWTESADTRTFSGEGVYRKTVTVLQPKLLAAHKIILSLGDAKPLPPARGTNGSVAGGQARLIPPVREAAIVFVNGKRAGSVWQPPYELDLGKSLGVGENKIEIHVFNLAVNQMAGKPLVDYAALNAKFGTQFELQSREAFLPVPAGLFGPITITGMD